MIHIGLRRCKEQKELRWGDVILKTDSDDKEYLEYFGRQTKTRTGQDSRNQRAIKPRMHANNDAISVDRDPVHVYKMYKEKRPPYMLEPDSSFYLSVNYFKTETRASLGGNNWFKAQPMGVNKLHNMMKDVTQTVGISNSGKTNHTGRKTLFKKLQDSGVPPNQITQIMAGHKNVQSVNNCSSLSRKANGKYFTYSFLDNQSRYQRRTDRKQLDSTTPGRASNRFNLYHFIYLGCVFLQWE